MTISVLALELVSWQKDIKEKEIKSLLPPGKLPKEGPLPEPLPAVPDYTKRTLPSPPPEAIPQLPPPKIIQTPPQLQKKLK